MNREILFRAKSIEPSTEGKWVFGSLTMDCHGNCWICHPLEVPMVGGFQYFNVDPKTVGQFTGLTDKNGTKIFEWDIVEEQYKSHEIIYNVFWDEDYFAFRVKSKDYSYYLDELVPSNSEVIGNIYDNPELLK